MSEQKRLAVIGCGVAGLTAAHLLQRRYDVTVFERNDYPGGHTHTIVIPDGPDAGVAVDTGFIVCNNRTYPLFHRLLDQLGVRLRDSVMSFSYHDEDSGFHYSGGSLNGLFAQRRNLFRPTFWRMLLDIRCFCRTAGAALAANTVPAITIGEYLQQGRYSREFVDWYLVPMMAAIWSAPPAETTAFPAAALLRFFRNHGLLSLRDRPTWQTVVGGSHAYVQAFVKQFAGTLRLSCPVRAVRRAEQGVVVTTADGETVFDDVVIAAHADEAVALLADPSPEECRLLGPWRYQNNRVVLHSDIGVLPPTRCAWASWNYSREPAADATRPVSVSYYMNLLQGLSAQRHYCTTLNRCRPVLPASVVRELDYAHPVYSFASMGTQAELASLNGVRHTYFCGSYFGYGFHEDAVRAGAAVGGLLGVEL
jgi:predicted NAD/FAD-binding protein